MTRSLFVRVSMELLYPNAMELHALQEFVKTPSLVKHHIIVQSIYSPAHVTYNVPQTQQLLENLKEKEWQLFLEKNAPPLYLT